MRRGATALVLACVIAGCGTQQRAATTAQTTTQTTPRQTTTSAAQLRVGVVGPLQVPATGAAISPIAPSDAGAYRLVLVAPNTLSKAGLRALAAAHPATQFAAVGASVQSASERNLAGIVLRDDQAALLGGIVAGLVVRAQTSVGGRAAWVGPEERRLAADFARGVTDVAPGATVLRVWSPSDPASCKEAALSAIDRGALAVMAHGGACATAAAAGAHTQNQPALRLSDFELPGIAASSVVRDAELGVFHGGHDVVFGATTGAIAVRSLDPLVPSSVALQARAAAQQLASGLRPTG
jgi:basic membrane lipoprotein Med (substrate-binding protein (PBP1-ABC) superfamily)